MYQFAEMFPRAIRSGAAARLILAMTQIAADAKASDDPRIAGFMKWARSEFRAPREGARAAG